MEIHNKKHHRRPSSSSRRVSVDPDFASLLNEGGLEWPKRVLKWASVILVVAFIGWGGYTLFAGEGSQDTSTGKYANSSSINSESSGDAAAIYAQCVSDVREENEALSPNDSDFYPRLIAMYDTWLGCYDEYPEATGRLSIEFARQSAIDSAGAYRSVYLSTNSYEYEPSTRSSSAATDTGGTGSSGSDDNNSGAPVTTPEEGGSSVDVQWCSAKKSEVDALYASYQEARDKVDAINTELQKVPYARPPGFTGTQSQLDAWRASETQRLTSQKAPLVTDQNTAYSAYNSAYSEYRGAGCY